MDDCSVLFLNPEWIKPKLKEFPSGDAIQAALSSLPFNDLLYGDTSKPINKEEMKRALKAAYQVDFGV